MFGAMCISNVTLLKERVLHCFNVNNSSLPTNWRGSCKCEPAHGFKFFGR